MVRWILPSYEKLYTNSLAQTSLDFTQVATTGPYTCRRSIARRLRSPGQVLCVTTAVSRAVEP